MANITLSCAEAFDTVNDIRDFCSERGKGLVTVSHKSDNASIIKKSSNTSLKESPLSTNKCN
jgi:hypothetical protein